jgi:nitroimidazol reductase NimA-like FMN-containing flavoprotein (pyridoxamine 5'-phosphate oxidase superfamily)
MDETGPELTVLPEYECWQLLRDHRPRLGRLAFVDAGWPLVLPVNYLAVGTLLYIRTAPGSKLLAAVRVQQVTFEVDDVDEAVEEGWSVLRPWARGERPHLLRMDVSVVSGRRLR